ncbi:hypothetical protein GCM10009547_49110 [Sporichthya brevicatena]|uniref:Adhesin n=1 Tax=Sporichthya brevicatena TaxID=171442 RepID=A0ABP3SKR5_9ACTN
MTPQTYAWPVDGPLQLSVRLGHGSLTIDAREDVSEAVVTLTPADADGLDRFTVDLRGRTLVVHAPRNSGWRKGRGAVDATIVVPAGTTAKLATATADISVTGRLADADVAAGTAAVDVATVTGNLRARVGAGSTNVGTAHGDVDLAAGSGTLTVGIPEGVSVRLDVRTGSGVLRSDLPVEDGPRAGSRAVSLRARIGRGDVHLVRAPAA